MTKNKQKWRKNREINFFKKWVNNQKNNAKQYEKRKTNKNKK